MLGPILLVLSLGFVAWQAARQPLAWAQQAASPEPSKPAPNQAEAARQASELLKQAHAQMISQSSVRAEVLELAHLTTPPLQMTGTYLSAGIKLRLEYQVKLPGGQSGKLLEVCDGERLWSYLQLPDSSKVTRRDVRQILSAAERADGRSDRAAAVDLALGGLAGLLTSLQRSLVFDAVKEETADDVPVVTLVGRWNAELSQQLGGDARQPRFPAHIPDAVRLSLAKDTLFPVRLAYLKRSDNGVKLLLDLRFRNIMLGGAVSDSEFDFVPPEGIEPEDVTRDYLKQLFPEQSNTTAPAP
ncbi:hypothetical protein GC163_05380 [bacterium]|nr:hypothetical protein [bacterium]